MIVRRQFRGGYQATGLVELARELRKKQTSAEGLLWQLLRNRQLLEFKFRRQHQFGDYIADFYCHEVRLVIECDGSVHDPHEREGEEETKGCVVLVSPSPNPLPKGEGEEQNGMCCARPGQALSLILAKGE